MPTPSDASRTVDPWRFAGSFIKGALSGGIPDQPARAEIPWAPVRKSVRDSKLALVSTAGISMRTDPPFDMDGERQRPTWGDPSWRRLRADATSDTVAVDHLHVDTGYIERDLNVALPLDRARELIAAGELGSLAESHYSVMGYQGGDTSVLQSKSAPEIAAAMRAEEVDLALLAPV